MNTVVRLPVGYGLAAPLPRNEHDDSIEIFDNSEHENPIDVYEARDNQLIELGDKTKVLALEVFEELDSYGYWASAAQPISASSPNTTSSNTVTIDPGGASLAGGHFVPNAGGSLDYGLAVNRGGVGGYAGYTDAGGRYLGATAYFTPDGYKEVGFSMADLTCWGTPYNVGAFVGIDRDIKSLSAGFFGAVAVGPVTVAAGMALSVRGDRTIKYLKKYEGDDPDLKNKILILAERSFGGSISVSGGAAYMGVGAGARLDVSKDKKVQMELYITEEQFGSITESQSTEQRIRKKIQLYDSLAREDAMALADLADPTSLPKGFAFRAEVTGMIRGGIVIQKGPIRTGHVVTMKGEFTLSLRKMDDKHVEVYTQPIKLQGNDVYVDAAGLGQIGYDTVDEISAEQSWVFDITKESALDAYRACLQGRLPTNLKFKKVDFSDDFREAEDMAAAWANENLPEGVTRTLLSRARVKCNRVGFEVGWFNLKLAHYRLETHGRYMIGDGKNVITRTQACHTKTTLRPLGGKETFEVSALVNKLTVRNVNKKSSQSRYTHEILNVAAQISFNDTKIFGSEMNNKIVDPLNKAFNLGIPRYHIQGHGQARQVNGEFLINNKDLLNLSEIRMNKLVKICDEVGADFNALKKLVLDLSGNLGGTAHSEVSKAEAVQGYIEAQGLRGCIVLYRLLDKKIYLRTTCKAYHDAVEMADRLAIKYRRPIRRTGYGSRKYIKGLQTRFAQVYKTIETIRIAMRDLYDDSIMKKCDSKAWLATHKSLFYALGTALRCVSLDHLQQHEAVEILKHINKLPSQQMIMVLRVAHAGPISDDFDPEDVETRFSDVRSLRNKIKAEQAKCGKAIKDGLITSEDFSAKHDKMLKAQRQLDEIVDLTKVSTERLEEFKEYFEKEDAHRVRSLFMPRLGIHREIVGKVDGILEARRKKGRTAQAVKSREYVLGDFRL